MNDFEKMWVQANNQHSNIPMMIFPGDRYYNRRTGEYNIRCTACGKQEFGDEYICIPTLDRLFHLLDIIDCSDVTKELGLYFGEAQKGKTVEQYALEIYMVKRFDDHWQDDKWV